MITVRVKDGDVIDTISHDHANGYNTDEHGRLTVLSVGPPPTAIACYTSGYWLYVLVDNTPPQKQSRSSGKEAS